MKPTARKRAKPGPKPTNRPYNDPGQLGTESTYGSSESRARDCVAVELCVAGPMSFAKLRRAMQYQPEFLARVLASDKRFIETRSGWELRPAPLDGAKYGYRNPDSTARPRRSGTVPRTV